MRSAATRQTVYDTFGQNIADYANGVLERENIYRGGHLLLVVESGTSAASWPSGLTQCLLAAVAARLEVGRRTLHRLQIRIVLGTL